MNSEEQALRRQSDYQRLFQVLRWTAIIFVGGTIQLPTSHVYYKPGVYAVLVIAALYDFIWNLVLLRRRTGELKFTGCVLDLVWITFLQLPTGQIHSPFYFLFAYPILSAALVLDRRGVLIVGVLSSVALVPVLFLHLWGAPLDLNHVFSYFVRFGLIFLCGFLGGQLASQREGWA